MAVAANALSLAEYAVMSNNPLVQAVTFSLLDNGSVMARDIPFVNKETLIANGVRWQGNLPAVNWVQINAEGPATKGAPTPFQESAYILRNTIDVDKTLVRDQNQIADPRGLQLAAYLRAVAYDFNDKFINNNHPSGDANAPVGIRARIDATTSATNMPYGVRNGNKIDAGVDLSTASPTAANVEKFLEALDQALWSVGAPDGQGVTLYMNEVMQRRFASAIRSLGTSGGFDITQDQFGRVMQMYKGAVVRDIGYKADQTTRIITTTETSAGVNGSSNYTSIYAVRFAEDGLYGWQYEPLQAVDIGLLESGVAYRTYIDWTGGLYNASVWSMARLYDVKIS